VYRKTSVKLHLKDIGVKCAEVFVVVPIMIEGRLKHFRDFNQVRAFLPYIGKVKHNVAKKNVQNTLMGYWKYRRRQKRKKERKKTASLCFSVTVHSTQTEVLWAIEYQHFGGPRCLQFDGEIFP
jgi:hypothetical protein